MARPKWCARCSWEDTSLRHRAMHWHLWCRSCRRPRLYRGAQCAACFERDRALFAPLIADILNDRERKN